MTSADEYAGHAIDALATMVEQVLQTGQPPTEIMAGWLAAAHRMEDRWRTLSRAMSDESLYQDPDEMDAATKRELMAMGCRSAAADLASAAAAAMAVRMIERSTA